MKNLRSAVPAAAAFAILVASLVFGDRTTTAGAPADKDVRVVNTAAEPVPVVPQGTLNVAGTVGAQQSGSWSR